MIFVFSGLTLIPYILIIKLKYFVQVTPNSLFLILAYKLAS